MTWDSPVLITDRRGERVIIDNCEDALVFMANEWPAEPGFLFARARKCCAANLKNRNGSHVAEMAFRAAVVELGMFPASRYDSAGTRTGVAR